MPPKRKTPQTVSAYHHQDPAPMRGSQLPPEAQGKLRPLANADLNEPGNWYVYVANGGLWNVIAGPFLTHGAACDVVCLARALAIDNDTFAEFYEFGTCKMAPEFTRLGVLNALLVGVHGVNLPLVPQGKAEGQDANQ